MPLKTKHISSPSLPLTAEWAEIKKSEKGNRALWEKERKVRKLRKYLYKLVSSTYKTLNQVKELGFEKGNSANFGREEKLEEKQ